MSDKTLLISIISLSLGLGFTSAQAETANFYECKGGNASLTFSTSGFASSTYANVTIGKNNYTADESTLETESSVMGDVETLTIKMVPDLEIVKASFIIPAVNLGLNLAGDYISKANFKSQLVITTIATPFIGGPYIGVVNKSRYIDLICTASLVF